MIRARLPTSVLDPLLHLGGGLVGEGDRQDRAGVGLALGDQPGDPPGQHPGLAGPGAGHDQQRRARVHHRRALRLVEALEQLVGTGTAALGALRLGELQPRQGARGGTAHLGLHPTSRHPRRRLRRARRVSACGRPDDEHRARRVVLHTLGGAADQDRSVSPRPPAETTTRPGPGELGLLDDLARRGAAAHLGLRPSVPSRAARRRRSRDGGVRRLAEAAGLAAGGRLLGRGDRSLANATEASGRTTATTVMPVIFSGSAKDVR